MTTRVLIVEDHRVLAEGLALLLRRQPGLEVVGTPATVEEGVRLAAAERPDVVLMDYHLPDGNGADATRSVLALVPAAAVVMLTAETSDAVLHACIDAGASGYLLKHQVSEQVVDAVRRAAGGETVLPAGMLARALEYGRRAAREKAHSADIAGRLTGREREVLALLGAGLDNRAIADRLGIGYATVRSHVQTVIEKLGARSRLEAVARAAEAGLLER